MSAETIYYVVPTGKIYRYETSTASFTQLSDRTAPTLVLGQTKDWAVQLLNSLSLTDTYNEYAAKSVTSEVVVDNDNYIFIDGVLPEAVSGAIDELRVTLTGANQPTPYLYGGLIRLVNTSGETETVSYITYTEDSSSTDETYLFTLDTDSSSAVSLSYSYAAGDEADVIDPVLLRTDDDDFDSTTDSATGLFVFPMAATSRLALDVANGNFRIDNPRFELTIFENGAALDAFPFDIQWLSTLNYLTITPAAVPGSWSTFDSRFVRQALTTAYSKLSTLLGTDEIFIRRGTSHYTDLGELLTYIENNADFLPKFDTPNGYMTYTDVNSSTTGELLETTFGPEKVCLFEGTIVESSSANDSSNTGFVINMSDDAQFPATYKQGMIYIVGAGIVILTDGVNTVSVSEGNWVVINTSVAKASIDVSTDIELSVGSSLMDIATLAPTDGNIIVGDGANWTAESGATARASLGVAIGSDVQAHDDGLDAIAALAVTDGNIIVGDGANWVAESGATARTSLGLGTIATQDANNVAITGGSIVGITDLAIADGGTGASTKVAAQTALGIMDAVDYEAHGFTDRSETSIGFDDATYLFTLTDAGAGWSYWRDGIKYSIAGNKTVTLPGTPPTKDMYFIYIDAIDGTLTASTTVWNLEADSSVLVAIIEWDNALTPKYQLADERHTVKWNKSQHAYEHLTYGTRLESLGATADYTIEPAVPADADNTYSIGETKIRDEDIQITNSALSAGGTYHIAYRTAASTWEWVEQAIPYKYGTYIQYDNAGTMTDLGNGEFVNTYALATNNQSNARFTIIHGQAKYATKALALAETVGSLTLTGLDLQEGVFLYRYTWETKSTYVTAGECRLAAVTQISANLATQPTQPGLGTMSTQDADGVAITGGTIDGVAITGGTIDGTTLGDTSASSLKKIAMTAAIELTISSGAITATQLFHSIDGESDAADDLATITYTGGNLLVIYPESAYRNITLKHGTGNIVTGDGNDYEIPDDGLVILAYDGANWRIVGGTGSETTAYTTTFDNADLLSGNLTVTHSLGQQAGLAVVVSDNNNKIIVPDDITFDSTSASTIDLGSYGTITGTWTVGVIKAGGGGSGGGGMSNPMTTAGDVIYGGSGGTPTRLAAGTASQVLAMNSGATAPEWVAAGNYAYQYEFNWLDAAAWTPDADNPCGVSTLESSTNGQTYDVLSFDGGTDGSGDTFAWLKFRTPDFWDAGTIKAKIRWQPQAGASASDNVRFYIAGVATSDDDTIDAAVGTLQNADDAVIAVGDDHETAATSAITVAGTPAAGDLLWLKLGRDYDYAGVGTAMAEKAYVLGVTLQIGKTTTVTAW